MGAVKKANAEQNQTEQVNVFMSKLDHPLKKEIETVRSFIKEASPKVNERVKWNAPSFFYKEDIITIHVKAQHMVHLIFHHANIVKVTSGLLEGDYKDRRMVYLKDMKSVKAAKPELKRIMLEMIAMLD